ETGPMGIASNLTWTGYEFLEAARDEGTWQTAKGAAAKGAGMTFAAVLAGLVALATDQVKQRLGLPPGH
ncbi:MAG: hypothetical protein JWO31_81, partial [Phycisphaerales bacterium]|nr:hypothetical protein [Phycisphaerales bacterium]